MLSHSNFGETLPLIELKLFPCNFGNHTGFAFGSYTGKKKKKTTVKSLCYMVTREIFKDSYHLCLPSSLNI